MAAASRRLSPLRRARRRARRPARRRPSRPGRRPSRSATALFERADRRCCSTSRRPGDVDARAPRAVASSLAPRAPRATTPARCATARARSRRAERAVADRRRGRARRRPRRRRRGAPPRRLRGRRSPPSRDGDVAHRPRLAPGPRLPPGDPLHPPGRRRHRGARRARGRRDRARATRRSQVKKDLLDAYQARLDDYLDEADARRERGFGPALAESAALVARLLADPRPRVRGAARRRRARARPTRTSPRSSRGASPATAARLRGRATRRSSDLDGFTAAPFTPEEQARRAAQLTRFLDLVPIEYDHGTEDGAGDDPVRAPGGASPSSTAPQSALDDLEPAARRARPGGGRRPSRRDFAELRRLRRRRPRGRRGGPARGGRGGPRRGQPTRSTRCFPEEWKESSDEADFDLVDISSTRWRPRSPPASTTRPSRRACPPTRSSSSAPRSSCSAFDPQLVAEVEGLVWYGARGERRARRADRRRAPTSREVRETRLVARRGARRGPGEDRRGRQRRRP